MPRADRITVIVIDVGRRCPTFISASARMRCFLAGAELTPRNGSRRPLAGGFRRVDDDVHVRG